MTCFATYLDPRDHGFPATGMLRNLAIGSGVAAGEFVLRAKPAA